MSDHSHIQWTDATWNPVTGCTKVSAGCKNCYAERDWARLSANPKTVYYGRKFTDVRCHPERLDQPLRWKKPRMIFVNSMSDLFHEDVPGSFIDQVFAVMALSPWHIYQILTKRPERMMRYFQPIGGTQRADWVWWAMGRMMNVSRLKYPEWPLANVWLGVSCEDQKTADERIPLLLQTPAAVRWISAEPLLNGIDLFEACFGPGASVVTRTPGRYTNIDFGNTVKPPPLDWVVVGGESGRDARPMMPLWVQSLRDQCHVAGVPFFFKQWGEWSPENELGPLVRLGKKAGGRLLDGREWNQYPSACSIPEK